jgi:cGMP-specific 3',5'-cyclic phosphodiesterase
MDSPNATSIFFQVLNLSSVAAWLGENLEDRDGFVPKTMLCLPIFNGQRDVIGVAQLINKVIDFD